MCRSDPHTPVASTRTIASSRSTSSGSGLSSTRTSPGAWKVTACIPAARYRVGAVPGAFFERDGDLLVPNELTRGPWDPGAQHAGPPSALVARAIERCEPRGGMRVGRITLEILRPVPLAPLSVRAELIRPGRSVELLEATLSGPEGELIRARAWRGGLPRARPGRRRRGARPRDEPGPPPAGPDAGTEGEFFATGEKVGYHT